jgi:uncharacterized membrane-anchored protein
MARQRLAPIAAAFGVMKIAAMTLDETAGDRSR